MQIKLNLDTILKQYIFPHENLPEQGEKIRDAVKYGCNFKTEYLLSMGTKNMGVGGGQ